MGEATRAGSGRWGSCALRLPDGSVQVTATSYSASNSPLSPGALRADSHCSRCLRAWIGHSGSKDWADQSSQRILHRFGSSCLHLGKPASSRKTWQAFFFFFAFDPMFFGKNMEVKGSCKQTLGRQILVSALPPNPHLCQKLCHPVC